MRLSALLEDLLNTINQEQNFIIRKEFSMMQNEKNRIWDQNAREAEEILFSHGFAENIPKYTDLVLMVKIFNASDYWRDWYRNNKR
jgi:hypothetical protein